MNSEQTIEHDLALGVLDWFRPGEHERVRRTIDRLGELNVTHLRTGISWADYHTREGREWIDWFIPFVAPHFDFLPCFSYTPPSLGVVPRTSAPPRDLKAYADFIDTMITDHGEHFDWVELWNEPNNIAEWDHLVDPGWRQFAEMIIKAAYWARERGKKTLLGGMCPVDPGWLEGMAAHGVLEHMDAIGIHCFPGTWNFEFASWADEVCKTQELLDKFQCNADIWITETGYSTWRQDPFTQLQQFVDLLDAPVDRAYWYALDDLSPALPHKEGFHLDERHYYCGIIKPTGESKLLHRIWANSGIEGARAFANMPNVITENKGKDRCENVVVGGAGFIGTNLTHALANRGEKVLIYDSLSRPGVEENIEHTLERYGDNVRIMVDDVRNTHALQRAIRGASNVFHLAAQVAVTTSLDHPDDDFSVNAQGTLNVLEAIRGQERPPRLIFTSTNKVYGSLDSISLERKGERYAPDERSADAASEQIPLEFRSPYGCSKGTADQYVLDYAQSYGIPATVFRMSCIYGPHQCGNEDQGWVAHFARCILEEKPITIYGDGCQVRDILFVTDLVRAFLDARDNLPGISGEAFNIGGGLGNAVSLREVLHCLEELTGKKAQLHEDDWREGDQRYYVSDTSKFGSAVGWKPQVRVEDGLERLCQWLRRRALVPNAYAPSNLSKVS